MDKKTLSERDVCTKLITPAIAKAGWNIKKQVREEVSFTDGRVIVQGSLHTRGQQKRADDPIRTTSGVKNIISSEISQLFICMFSLEEQNAILEKVNALMGFCDSLEKEIEQNTQQLESLMQSCLREVFEGKEKEVIG